MVATRSRPSESVPALARTSAGTRRPCSTFGNAPLEPVVWSPILVSGAAVHLAVGLERRLTARGRRARLLERVA